MASKTKRSEGWEHARRTQPRAEDSSASHTVNHSEIRRRAYEIYLERGGLPGCELEDWLQAECELRNAAPFARNRDGLQQQYNSNSGDRN